MARIHHNTIKKAKTFKIELTLEDNDVVASKDGVRLASGPQGNKVLEQAITKLTGKPAKGAAVKMLMELGRKPKSKPVRKVEQDEELDEEETGDESDALAEEDDSDADQSRSVVKAKYKALYKPHKDKCGDDISKRVNAHVTVEDPETGDKRVSLKALRQFATANSCWVPAYAQLISRTGGWNSGMALMNVNNRLRAKIRRAKKDGDKFEIQWV